MRSRPILCVAFTCLAHCLPATATSIYNYESYGNTLDGPLGTVSGTCTSETYTSQNWGLSNCSSATGVLTSANSFAGFESLHADSTLSLTAASIPNGITASGYARTVDTGVADASVAYLGFTFGITTTLFDSGLSQARSTFNFGFNYGTPVSGLNSIGCSRSLASGTVTLSYTCATPLYAISAYNQYDYFFSASAQLINGSNNSKTGSGFVSTDVTILSLQPYDINLNYLPNAFVSSVGNGNAQAPVAPVPEPPAPALTFVAAALLVFGSRRQCSGATARISLI